MHRSLILPLITLVSACEVPVEGLPEAEEEGVGYRTKDEGGPNGDFNYCDGATLCLAGEGDCENDAQCDGGLVCGLNNGSQFGLHWSVDACTDATCANGSLDGGESAIDFGGVCGSTCGGLNGDEEGYCTVGCPCALGEGDCDSDDECAVGLSCVNNKGDRFGIGDKDDVCLDVLTVGDLKVGDLVVTEVMIDSLSVTDAAGEWFEVFNTTNADIDVNGLLVRKRVGNLQFTVNVSLVVESHGFLVFAKNGNFALNGGVVEDVDYVNTYTFNNVADSIVLDNGPLEIDRLVWTAAWPNPVGRSIQLDKFAVDDVANNDPLNWCESSVLLPGGDFGTPNATNGNCP